MGNGEIATMLGVSRQRVYQITREKGFPDPLVRLTMGQVWLAEEVEVWRDAHRPPLDEPDEA